MTALTADQHAKALAWLTDKLVQAVHDRDRDTAGVWLRRCLSLDAPTGAVSRWQRREDSMAALAMLLAAQIPPDRPLSSRLLWLSEMGDELADRDPHPKAVRPIPLKAS